MSDLKAKQQYTVERLKQSILATGDLTGLCIEGNTFKITEILGHRDMLAFAIEKIEQLQVLTEEKLTKAYLEGFRRSAEGYNGEHPFAGNSDESLKKELGDSIDFHIKQIGLAKTPTQRE